jgi:predicted nucleic-acid-binding protein
MIGIDTNVLVRLLVADTPEQATAARVLVEEAEGRGEKVFVNRLVLAECLWVLASTYRTSKTDALSAVEKLAGHPVFVLEDRDAWTDAVATARKGRQEVVDLVVAATNAGKGCDTTFTFDRIAARNANFTLLP